jgi:CRISPR/Cas system CMR-associated protein Cmr5 small subunit
MALTLEQHRMQRAYESTRAAIGRGAGVNKAWSRVVMPFGTHVQRQGLLQALAFLARDANEDDLKAARDILVESLRTHLVDRGFLGGSAGNTNLIDTVAALEAAEYMFVTREVLAISIWFKRAAQALCE